MIVNKSLKLFTLLAISFSATIANAAPGEQATKISPLCSVLAPSSFTIPDRVKGKEAGFRESILDHDTTPLNAVLKIDAFEKGDFSFVTFTKTLPTFPITQPSLDKPSVDEVPNNSINTETRYIIGGGNSSNEVCVYSYQIFQVAGQYIRTSIAVVDVKTATE